MTTQTMALEQPVYVRWDIISVTAAMRKIAGQKPRTKDEALLVWEKVVALHEHLEWIVEQFDSSRGARL